MSVAMDHPRKESRYQESYLTNFLIIGFSNANLADDPSSILVQGRHESPAKFSSSDLKNAKCPTRRTRIVCSLHLDGISILVRDRRSCGGIGRHVGGMLAIESRGSAVGVSGS